MDVIATVVAAALVSGNGAAFQAAGAPGLVSKLERAARQGRLS